MSNLTTLQISLSKFPKQSKKASPNSTPMKKYSMNQHPSMKTNYYSLAANQKLKNNPVNIKTHTNLTTKET